MVNTQERITPTTATMTGGQALVESILAQGVDTIFALPGIQLDGASDHGVSQALYLRDPDENGVELYWDRPEAEWPRSADGKLSMFTRRLDLEDLLKQRAA